LDVFVCNGDEQEFLTPKGESYMIKRMNWIAMAILALAITVSAAVPQLLSYQGRAENANGPMVGNYDVTFSLYSTSSGGTALWTEGPRALLFDEGVYQSNLGGIESLSGLDFSQPLFLEIEIDGQVMDERVELTSVPYAMYADKAENADYATEAGHATTADNATNADNATEANHAATAGTAVKADTAAYSDTAEVAGHATTADHAGSAETSLHAATADKATYADSAGLAGHSVTADNATEADHAATADNATTADSSRVSAFVPVVSSDYMNPGETNKGPCDADNLGKIVYQRGALASEGNYYRCKYNGAGGGPGYEAYSWKNAEEARTATTSNGLHLSTTAVITSSNLPLCTEANEGKFIIYRSSYSESNPTADTQKVAVCLSDIYPYVGSGRFWYTLDMTKLP